jgi:hypothetical protein
VSTICEFEPERIFGWAVADPEVPAAQWRFTLELEGSGTRIRPIWGGIDPQAYDCSGLVYAAPRSAGLTRTTYEMHDSWFLVPISKSHAQPGDLAFYGTGHVEFYAHTDGTYGAADSGTLIGLHLINAYWYPTMYFRVRL